MFDAWQAQQRAQKDQERKAKTEAAAALQGYRRSGLSEEETKLAALREKERLQKLKAEQDMRGYRSQLTAEEAKLAVMRQEELRKKQEHEEQLRNNLSSHDPAALEGLEGNTGVVSALANKIQSPATATKKKSQAKINSSPDVTPENSPVGVDNIASVDPKASVPVEPKPTPAPTVATDVPPETSQVAKPATSKATKKAPPPPPRAAPSPKPYRSSVKFMFGILTAGGDDGGPFPQNRSHLVEGYLARADQIAKSVISDKNHSSFESILLSMAYPTASSVKKDNSRTDSNRIMVTVTISYTAPNRATSSDFKTKVIDRVRSAISSGNFTKLD